MDHTYWHRQTADQPLFPELQWSRPENRTQAGKLSIIGGNLHGFTAPAEAYAQATKAGIGTCRVLLPDAVRSVVKAILPEVEFAPSTPSGSFNQRALDSWLDLASWGDATLLAGDLGRNSETSIVFESFVHKYTGPLIITKDAANYAISIAEATLNRPNTTLVITTEQAQKLGIAAKSTIPITLGMTFNQLVEALHELTKQYPVHLVVRFHETICVASGGRVSSTKLTEDRPLWRVNTAATAAVWQLQNPEKSFEALTTSLVA